RDARDRRRDGPVGRRPGRRRRERGRLVPGRGGERGASPRRNTRPSFRHTDRRRRHADGAGPDRPAGGPHRRTRVPVAARVLAGRSDKVLGVTPSAFERLRERLGEVNDLTKAVTLLFWDQRVMMPPGGGAARAEALGTVSRLAQERFVDSEIGRLLDELRPLEESSDYDSFEASLIRVTRRRYEKATRVPPALVGEMRRASALALSAWGPAKEASDFEQLRPHLETLLELRQRYVACFEPADETYDLLLDDYEPEMKAAEVRLIFDELKEQLRPLISELAEADDVDDSFLHGEFDPVTQRR